MGPLEVLKQRFGFDQFRGLQEPVIEAVLQGESGLLIAPTGSGKSLCYQVPSELLGGLTLVISPLIALMKDQVDQARRRGLNCSFINSSLSRQERERRYQDLREKKYSLLYVTPERFRKEEFCEALACNEVKLLAVDEAHCISQWGHDFRPDYSRLKQIRQRVGSPPTLALTATATPEVQADIRAQLDLADSAQTFLAGMERENLALRVEEVYGGDEKIRSLVGLRHLYPGPCIVYFSLISSLQKAAAELRPLGVDPIIYHGQLPEVVRRKAQDRFMGSDSALVLATPAFGLGVDKANVRSVIHAELPGSIEAYYQEVGRAGRDGEDSHCVLLYDPDDVSIQMDFIKWASPDPGFIREVYRLIEKHPERVMAEGPDFMREQLNFYNRRDFRVETALNLLERWDCIERAERGFAIDIVGELPEEYLDEALAAQKLRRQNEKLHGLVEWVKSESCRAQSIYDYFGAKAAGVCGRCDICESEKH